MGFAAAIGWSFWGGALAGTIVLIVSLTFFYNITKPSRESGFNGAVIPLVILGIISVVVAAFTTQLLAAQYPSGTPDKPGDPVHDFKLIFHQEPPSRVKILDSGSSTDGGYTTARVRFKIAEDELADLVVGWDPGKVSEEKLPPDEDLILPEDCDEVLAYLNQPWNRDGSIEYSAVLYCVDTQIAVAVYSNRE